MGYRSYLNKIPKNVKQRYAHFSSIEQMHDAIGTYKPLEMERLYELGTTHRFEQVENFFSFDLEEEEMFFVTKEMLEEIIKSYQVDTYNYYKRIHESEDSFLEGYKEEQLKRLVANRMTTWKPNKFNGILNFKDASEVDGVMTGSFDKEYAVFNILFLYHTFDWENYDMLYTAG